MNKRNTCDGSFANATTPRRQQTQVETATEIAIGPHIESEPEAETLHGCKQVAFRNNGEHDS